MLKNLLAVIIAITTVLLISCNANVEPKIQSEWEDNFDSINLDAWTFEEGGDGWGNQELQYYTNGDNASIEYDESIDSNVLIIEARRSTKELENNNCWYGDCGYTSSRMVTKGKKVFKYGRIEARIKLPQTQGIWPAFWMLGSSYPKTRWPHSGEIDIMEHVGYEPSITHGALHGPGYSGKTPITGNHDLQQSVDKDYHIYTVEWNSESIQWFVDDQQFYSVSRKMVVEHGKWVFDQPFFILFNVAVGGSWPKNPDETSEFPQKMYVDYVRVSGLE